jgi:CheY-like chemotaxis protein
VTVDQQLRVVVVDDHQMFRDGLATLLDALAEVEVVGRASSGEEAVELAASTAPDVMLMDLHMPGIGGVEATRRITAAQPAIAVIALTMLDDDRSVRAGAQPLRQQLPRPGRPPRAGRGRPRGARRPTATGWPRCGSSAAPRRSTRSSSERAAFLGTEDTILYSSCFDANTGLFETLLDEQDA